MLPVLLLFFLYRYLILSFSSSSPPLLFLSPTHPILLLLPFLIFLLLLLTLFIFFLSLLFVTIHQKLWDLIICKKHTFQYKSWTHSYNLEWPIYLRNFIHSPYNEDNNFELSRKPQRCFRITQNYSYFDFSNEKNSINMEGNLLEIIQIYKSFLIHSNSNTNL